VYVMVYTPPPDSENDDVTPLMVWVPDAVSPVSLLPAVNVTTTVSPTTCVPEDGVTDVTVNVGAVTSTVTEIVSVAVFPAASVAVAVRV
ncbi:MAG: hypothetical protein ABGY22_06225, partial [Acidimicrobiales bacterium]